MVGVVEKGGFLTLLAVNYPSPCRMRVGPAKIASAIGMNKLRTKRISSTSIDRLPWNSHIRHRSYLHDSTRLGWPDRDQVFEPRL